MTLKIAGKNRTAFRGRPTAPLPLRDHGRSKPSASSLYIAPLTFGRNSSGDRTSAAPLSVLVVGMTKVRVDVGTPTVCVSRVLSNSSGDRTSAAPLSVLVVGMTKVRVDVGTPTVCVSRVLSPGTVQAGACLVRWKPEAWRDKRSVYDLSTGGGQRWSRAGNRRVLTL